MNRNLVGSFYGRFSIKISHFILIRHTHGCHGQFLFLIGWNLKIFSSETRRQNELLLYRKDVWEILYKIAIFRADHATNMAAIFVLGQLKFCRKHIWKVLYKVSSKQNDRWATQAQPTVPLVFISYGMVTTYLKTVVFSHNMYVVVANLNYVVYFNRPTGKRKT